MTYDDTEILAMQWLAIFMLLMLTAVIAASLMRPRNRRVHPLLRSMKQFLAMGIETAEQRRRRVAAAPGRARVSERANLLLTWIPRMRNRLGAWAMQRRMRSIRLPAQTPDLSRCERGQDWRTQAFQSRFGDPT